MSTVRFDREVGDLTGSLGDPTRRRIYLAVRASPEPVTTAIIAETFAVHTNVARHHLGKGAFRLPLGIRAQQMLVTETVHFIPWYPLGPESDSQVIDAKGRRRQRFEEHED